MKAVWVDLLHLPFAATTENPRTLLVLITSSSFLLALSDAV